MPPKRTNATAAARCSLSAARGRDVLPHSDRERTTRGRAPTVGERLQLRRAASGCDAEEKPFASFLAEDLRIEQRRGRAR